MPILGVIASSVAKASASYESIATLTGDASGTVLTFNSIPQTYKHLQIRGFANSTISGGITINGIRFNGDTGTNYSSHYFATNGSTVYTGGNGTASIIDVDVVGGSSASTPYVVIVDIFDYTSTSKYKTVTILGGLQKNASGSVVEFNSGTWKNTSAITSISVLSNGNPYTTSSNISLYGIKGAT